MTKVFLKDWRKRLQKAVQCGEFSREDKSKAGGWNCCAIGERDLSCRGLLKINGLWKSNKDIFVRQKFGSTIFGLGMQFCQAVDSDEFVKVQDIIEQIEGLTMKEFYK